MFQAELAPKRKILLVEDEVIVALSEARHLRTRGLVVEVAKDGPTAVRDGRIIDAEVRSTFVYGEDGRPSHFVAHVAPSVR